MRVLYLAKPAGAPDRLTAYSFVDEEILSLLGRGVFIYHIAHDGTTGQELPEHHRNLHQVSLATRHSLSELFSTLVFMWSARQLIPFRSWFRLRRLYRICRIEKLAAETIAENDIDVIHTNFGWPGGFGGVLASKATKCPLVASCRGMDIIVDSELPYGLRRGAGFDAAVRILLTNADRTIHNSDFIREKAILLGAHRDRAQTIRKGVDCDHFNTPCPNSSSENDPPVILTVGGLIKRKGVDVILDALAILSKTHRFKFLIVGDGKERQSLMDQCDQLSLADKTEFVGRVGRPEIPKFFANCDIFVLASIWEAAGNVLLEAMASGKAIVTTDSGGPPEYVAEGRTGFIVPVRNAECMANRIAMLLDDPELREQFGQRARIRAAEEFPYSKMVDRILEVYSTLQRVSLSSQKSRESMFRS